ncbi:MAG: 4Fe-4S dicluster domain-containing protein, partial [Actinobacteria bacterium]|nr:4Fe-4S dicluster domain-containing protein [Actinomycetota bacterium]
GLTAGFYGHCSVGCLHIRPFIDLRDPAQQQAMTEVAEEVAGLVASLGGVNSSEHGDGLARSQFNRQLFGAPLYEAMREVKRLFDPDGRMNPGKITDSPAMTENLRDPALPDAPQLVTLMDFGPGGMRGAADRCMNVGVCRKSSAGVMCPSYMATRDEEHATRGRANALVMALSSPDPRRALGGERLHEALDLCLECKACKRECPLGVDMASLKSEALAARHELRGVPLRSRLFASIRSVNRVGSAVAPVANAVLRLPGRRAAQRLIGIAPDRPLPRFAGEDLLTWFRRHRPPAEVPAGEVVVLADSFTTFSEPQIGVAAVELLEMAGHRVTLAHEGCCGRPAISKGLLAVARRQAAAMVARLAEPARRGIPIVGVEPSCVLTLRDEYPALLGDSAAVRAVANAARLADSLLLEAVRDGRLSCHGPSPVGRIVLHTHCHQRAITGSADTVALLEALPGAEVTELDSGCCGMAGSFGFEAEHYELSMQVGELRLFPALRAEPAGSTVVATGVSCRQQIAHGTGRSAVHPLQLLRLHAGS